MLITYFLKRWIHLVVKDPGVTKHIVETIVAHGNDKDGCHCDGSFSEFCCGCVYNSEKQEIRQELKEISVCVSVCLSQSECREDYFSFYNC